MSTALLISIFVATAILAAAVFTMARARRHSYAVRIMTALAFAPIALFCLYGFIAAREPGAYHWIWQIEYMTCFVFCCAAVAWLLLAPAENNSRD